ncbi:MAG: phenylalanine--tRNA ligase subunit beta [Anaeroplasmataceae bacterium]
MKVSYNWLKDYLNLDNIKVEDLSKIISTNVVEIEAEYPLCNATNLEIGYVKECEDIEGTHLHKTQIELSDGVFQIVCGAPNMRQGIKVIVARIGAVLPGDFKIKASKIRGVESNGMCCSLQELGFEDKYVPEEFKDGIYILPFDAPVGESPLKYLCLDDYVFDLELTSNRSDLLSIEGVAFDVAANINQRVKVKNNKPNCISEKNPINVKVETKSCPKYLARYAKDVVIKESPEWLRARLIAAGVRPINNVVDITNYVLMEMGQPLHSFDADKLGNNIVVREACEGEKLVTLDDIERELIPGDIVITDGKTPLCVAGVMGGASTEVTNETKNVVLEAAYFEPMSIRKTSQRLQLKSESSTRFERKIDYERVDRALDYACYLLEELADAKIMTGVASNNPEPYKAEVVTVTLNKVNKVLGTSLSALELENIFNGLAYEYTNVNNEYKITIPSRRMDLESWDQHIIEDVARVYGYNNIPTCLPKTDDKGTLTLKQRLERNVRYILSGLGMNETVTYSLIHEHDLYNYTLEELEPIKVLMPMTEDRALMRQSLLNGICDAISYNKARKVSDMAFFELGKKYSTEGETNLISGALCGLYQSSMWQMQKTPVDFFLVKGILDVLFNKIGLTVKYTAATNLNKNFHPGRTALITSNDKTIGFIGELHPRFIKEHDLPRVVVFELNEDIILELNNNEFKYKAITKFPSITRDLAIVCKKDIPASDIIDLVKQTAKKTLVDLQVFDLYVGENVAIDEKSIAIKLVFNDPTKTLETADVDKTINSIINRLDFTFKARLR